MITRTVKSLEVKVTRLLRFNGLEPEFQEETIILSNPRDTSEEAVRKAITRTKGADYTRKIVKMDYDKTACTTKTYGIEESVFFEHAKVIKEK